MDMNSRSRIPFYEEKIYFNRSKFNYAAYIHIYAYWGLYIRKICSIWNHSQQTGYASLDKTYNDKANLIGPYLPYYDEKSFLEILFRKSGVWKNLKEWSRVSRRSGESSMKILRAVQEENIILFEWEMTLIIRIPAPPSCMAQAGSHWWEFKIIEHRIISIWGDIFDNVPGLEKCTENSWKIVWLVVVDGSISNLF